MTWGTFLLYQSPRRLYLKGVDVAEDFLSVHGSRRSLLCAAKWHKELAAWLPMWHENNALLSLFWRSMKNLSRGLRPSLLDVRFAWRWGNIWGVAPSFETCPGCGSPLDGDDELPRSAEGFFCRSCHVRLLAESRRETTFYEPIRSVAFKLIKSASSLSAENFARAEPDMRSLFSADETLEGDVRGAASWIYSFLKVF
jgi:recombinational DNA repair protein (RecF pathway)